MNTWNLKDLEIVGYAESLPDDLLPAVVAPIYRVREDDDTLLMPPFDAHQGDKVKTTHVRRRAELDRLVGNEQATGIDKSIPAAPGQLLWIDESRRPHYQSAEQVRSHFQYLATAYLGLAREALILQRFDHADKLAQKAINADNRSLDAVLVAAVVERMRGNNDVLDVLSDIAKAIDPQIDFQQQLEIYLEGLLQDNRNVPISNLTPDHAPSQSSIASLAEGLDIADFPETLCVTSFVDRCNVAFQRELPALLETEPRKFVAYAGDKRLGIDENEFYLRERLAHAGPIALFYVEPQDQELAAPLW